jgi:hypothetical protein
VNKIVKLRAFIVYVFFFLLLGLVFCCLTPLQPFLFVGSLNSKVLSFKSRIPFWSLRFDDNFFRWTRPWTFIGHLVVLWPLCPFLVCKKLELLGHIVVLFPFCSFLCVGTYNSEPQGARSLDLLKHLHLTFFVGEPQPKLWSSCSLWLSCCLAPLSWSSCSPSCLFV